MTSHDASAKRTRQNAFEVSEQNFTKNSSPIRNGQNNFLLKESAINKRKQNFKRYDDKISLKDFVWQWRPSFRIRKACKEKKRQFQVKEFIKSQSHMQNILRSGYSTVAY